MDFIRRFAIGLASLPALWRVWPQVHLLAAFGALVDFMMLRFKQARPLKEALLRCALLLVVLELALAFSLAFMQAWFYWSPS